MRISTRAARRGLLLAAACFFGIFPAHADDWLPVTADELQQTDEPAAPKAPAIYLFRQIDRNDFSHFERVYVRIKILTEEGRARGNVEIAFDKEREIVHGIEARTIRPDGSIVKFEGTIYEKPVLEGRGVRVMTKAFSLPEVQPGCIIEYRFDRMTDIYHVFSADWIVSADLYTKVAKFSLEPYRGYVLRTTIPAGLPSASVGPTFAHGVYTMVTRDVPAFISEEYMPPEDELKMRVDFVYLQDATVDKDAPTFWTRWAKRQNEFVKRYTNERRAMEAALAEIVSPGDSPDQKLHKIYARVQRVRNLSYERRKSTQEAQRESSKDNEDVADVWKHGYGDEAQIMLLFVALARTAGIEADPVALATRNRFLFKEELRNPSQLNGRVAVVKLNGANVFLAPNTPFAPFGMLPWLETAVQGLRIDQSGTNWVRTPVPKSTDSRLVRKAVMRLAADSDLEGTVTLSYTGLYALTRRLEERNEDDSARRQLLEDDLKSQMTGSGEVTLANAPNWADEDAPLVAIFNVRLPAWAHTVGRRALVPVDIFAGARRHDFEHSTRTHAIYFHYPHRLDDEITIDLPSGWKVDSVPQPGSANINVADCNWTAQGTPTGLGWHRDFTIDTLLIDVKFYDRVREFYQNVKRSGDEEAVVNLPAGENSHASQTGL